MNRICIYYKQQTAAQTNKFREFHHYNPYRKIDVMKSTHNISGWRDRARERMTEMHITQRALAETLDVTQGTIGHWLAGRREPDLSMISALAEALGLDVAYLAFGYMDADKAAKMAAIAKNMSDDELDATISIMEKIVKKSDQ